MIKKNTPGLATKKAADYRQRAAIHSMLALDEEYNDLASYVDVEPDTGDILSKEMDRILETKGAISPFKMTQILQYDVQGYSPQLISTLMDVTAEQVVAIRSSDTYRIAKADLLKAVVVGARKYMEVATLKAVKTLVECLDSNSEKVRLAASQDLLNRAGLQATQQIELTTSVNNFENLTDRELEEILMKEKAIPRKSEVVRLVSNTTIEG